MKVYVVVTDPNYYCHYDSVWPTLDVARAHVMDRERAEMETHRSRAIRRTLESGRWAKYHIKDLNKMALVWGYRGYGDSYGIIEEETGGDERLQEAV